MLRWLHFERVRAVVRRRMRCDRYRASYARVCCSLCVHAHRHDDHHNRTREQLSGALCWRFVHPASSGVCVSTVRSPRRLSGNDDGPSRPEGPENLLTYFAYTLTHTMLADARALAHRGVKHLILSLLPHNTHTHTNIEITQTDSNI